MSGNVVSSAKQNGVDSRSSKDENWEKEGNKMDLGKQKVWQAEINNDGSMKIARNDGKFFEIDMITEEYDRPILVNYGRGVTSPVLVKGKIAVEPETIVASLDDKTKISQNRVLRASFDNPNFSGMPEGKVVGENYLDGQRIIYRDGAVKSTVSVSETAPKRKTKNGFIDCETISLKELGQTVDAPGKAALLDVLAKYLTDEEASEILNVIAERIYNEQLK